MNLMKNVLFSALALCLLVVASFDSPAQQTHKKQQVPLKDSIPHSVAPRNDSTMTCIPTSIELRWTPGVSFFDSYYVEVSGDSSFQNLIVNDVVFHDTTRIIHLPRADTSVYWRIRTDFDTTAIWRLNLRIPKAGSIVSPKADTVKDYTVKLVWNANSSGDRYELLVESEAFTLRDTVSYKDTSASVTVLGNKSYTWKMRPLCGDGVGEWSNSGSFFVDLAPNAVYEDLRSTESSWLRSTADGSLLLVRAPESEVLQQLNVYNLAGELVFHANLDGVAEYQLSSSLLAKGALMIQLRSDRNIFRKMLIMD